MLNNDPSNDYASIGSLSIGTVGPYADVWFKDCPTANFTGDIYGELHLPSLASSERILVAGGLLNYAHCGCHGFDPDTCPHPEPEGIATTEASPRWTDCAEHGAIRIAASDGLHGQIVFNGANTGRPWDGVVAVGSVLLQPTASQPLQAPYYNKVSADLGGGAVGLAPFHLYEKDCAPDHSMNGTADDIAEDVFNATPVGDRVLCRFYGPIKKKYPTYSWGSHIQVRMQPLPVTNGGIDPYYWIDVSSSFTIKGPGDSGYSDKRTITLGNVSGRRVSPGLYLVCPGVDDAVRCDNVTGSPSAVWPRIHDYDGDDYERNGYVFKVSPHCTNNCGCPIADFNHSGTVSVQDIFDFLTAYFSNSPSADVNNSGTVSVQDIFDFLSAYFSVAAGGTC